MRYAIPAAILAALIALFAIGLTKDPSRIPSPLIGKAAPVFNLPTLDGKGFSSVTGLAGRVHVVNFWASWCGPCLEEHPLMLEEARTGVPIVGIDYKDEPADAQGWLARHGNPFSLVAQDLDGRTAIDWGVYGVPETFVVNASGTIVFKHVGPMTREVWAAEIAPRVKG
jgi:cytochrome c biogenesis protein CcmG/thiol:disulfide interchange protein DsbE